MKKLVKVQREILAGAVESELRSGHKKPISVFAGYRGTDMTGHKPNFILYCKKMWELIDEGLIAEAHDGYAYLVDLTKAVDFLKTH